MCVCLFGGYCSVLGLASSLAENVVKVWRQLPCGSPASRHSQMARSSPAAAGSGGTGCVWMVIVAVIVALVVLLL